MTETPLDVMVLIVQTLGLAKMKYLEILKTGMVVLNLID
jgi:hypothetical protein